MGAFHAADLHFLFGSYMGVPMDESSKALGETMGDYWVQFAATGNPNRPGLPQWPAYNPTSDQLMELGEKIQVRTGFRKGECDLFDRVYETKAAKYKQRAIDRNTVRLPE